MAYDTIPTVDGTPATPVFIVDDEMPSQATSGLTPISDAAVHPIAPANATQRNNMSSLQLFNTSAVATEVAILDGATVIWAGYVPAAPTNPITVNFEDALRGSLNTAMNIQCATTGSGILWNAQMFLSNS